MKIVYAGELASKPEALALVKLGAGEVFENRVDWGLSQWVGPR